jgi:hypothetical protein
MTPPFGIDHGALGVLRIGVSKTLCVLLALFILAIAPVCGSETKGNDAAEKKADPEIFISNYIEKTGGGLEKGVEQKIENRTHFRAEPFVLGLLVGGIAMFFLTGILMDIISPWPWNWKRKEDEFFKSAPLDLHVIPPEERTLSEETAKFNRELVALLSDAEIDFLLHPIEKGSGESQKDSAIEKRAKMGDGDGGRRRGGNLRKGVQGLLLAGGIFLFLLLPEILSAGVQEFVPGRQVGHVEGTLEKVETLKDLLLRGGMGVSRDQAEKVLGVTLLLRGGMLAPAEMLDPARVQEAEKEKAKGAADHESQRVGNDAGHDEKACAGEEQRAQKQRGKEAPVCVRISERWNFRDFVSGIFFGLVLAIAIHRFSQH